VSEYASDKQIVEAKPRSAANSAPNNITIRWFPKAITILGAILLAAGAGIALFRPAMLVSPQAEINEAVRIYAGYLASRNLSLAIALLLALALRAKRALHTLLLLVAMVQSLDAVIDCLEHRWTIVPGVAILALLFFLASASLSGYPFWKIQAWNDAA
jgi:hypothetical protein